MKTLQLNSVDYQTALTNAVTARPNDQLSFITQSHDDSETVLLIFDNDTDAGAFATSCGVEVEEVANPTPPVETGNVDDATP